MKIHLLVPVHSSFFQFPTPPETPPRRSPHWYQGEKTYCWYWSRDAGYESPAGCELGSNPRKFDSFIIRSYHTICSQIHLAPGNRKPRLKRRGFLSISLRRGIPAPSVAYLPG